MTSNSRHVWEAPRGRGALGRRRLPTGATAKVQLARRAASPCEDARDLGEEGGKTRARGKELSGVLRVFPFFLFLTFLCLCFNGSHQFSGRLGQPRRPTEAHKPKRSQLRCVTDSQGLPLCLTPGHKITTGGGRSAHLAYLSTRSKCKR